MEQAGIRSDFALYKSLIIGCVKNNQMEMALKVYQNMRALGIHSSNVYRLEKKGGAGRTEDRPSLVDPNDLTEFHQICR